MGFLFSFASKIYISHDARSNARVMYISSVESYIVSEETRDMSNMWRKMPSQMQTKIYVGKYADQLVHINAIDGIWFVHWIGHTDFQVI